MAGGGSGAPPHAHLWVYRWQEDPG
ncbi:hypothetical protein PybrP1_007220 [[Pythium] brassicae (nom. inval.)]|nr:hypothetical protein PybrP1_007220 [[Pythium] brassicae (nom. inval.)]